MKLKCWMPEYEEEESAVEMEVDARDDEEAEAAEYVAGDAVEKWEDRGRFAGDPVPDEIVVHVRCPSGAVFAVGVTHDYSINFYTGNAKSVQA